MPCRPFAVLLFLISVVSSANADELVVVRSGVRADQCTQPQVTCPDGMVGIDGVCRTNGGAVAGGGVCTTADDCPGLTQIDIDFCQHYECISDVCELVSDCDPATESCDGSGACTVLLYRDCHVTALIGPETGPFPGVLDAASFEDARSGVDTYLQNPSGECFQKMTADFDAQWITTDDFAPGTTPRTALYAVDFELTGATILNASIDIYIRTEDQLGGGVNDGIYLNGQPLHGEMTDPACDAPEPFYLRRDDVAALLHPGTNTLYFNVTRLDGRSGILFSATIRVDSDGPHIVHVDDDAAPGGDGRTWLTAYDDLQGALDDAAGAADPVREVWVAEGTYVPTQLSDPADPRSAHFASVPNVTVYGGFFGDEALRSERDVEVYQTILSGDLLGNDVLTPTSPAWVDNAYHVVVHSRRDPRGAASWDGFTITHGNANGTAVGNRQGGGIHVAADGVLHNCSIVQNGATRGAIYVASKFEIADCDVSDNFARGLYASSIADVTLLRCNVNGNRSQDNGGAVYLTGNSTTEFGTSFSATQCIFANNAAKFNGGAVAHLDRVTITLTDCEFINHTTENNDNGVGYLFGGSSLFATRCLFRGNRPEGSIGCWRIRDSRAVFDDCVFTQNDASSFGAASCIASDSGSEIEVRRSSFEANTGTAIALSGGSFLLADGNWFGNSDWTALSLRTGPPHEIRNCRFHGRTFLWSRGGAVDVFGNSAIGDFATVNFSNCEFVGNEIWTNQSWGDPAGGAIHLTDTIATITNCSLVGNDANVSGGIYGINSLVTVVNSILRGNTDLGVDTLAAQLGGDVNTFFFISNSNVEGIGPGNGNIDAEAGFVRMPDDGGDGWRDEDDNDFGDLHLLPGSPCIDAADNTAVAAEVTSDLDGAPRFHDDTGTPDSGVGSAPVVDMGAYEFRPADCDNSGAVTLTDLADLNACALGPADSSVTPCTCFDLDADGRVDLRDVALFQQVFGQP